MIYGKTKKWKKMLCGCCLREYFLRRKMLTRKSCVKKLTGTIRSGHALTESRGGQREAFQQVASDVEVSDLLVSQVPVPALRVLVDMGESNLLLFPCFLPFFVLLLFFSLSVFPFCFFFVFSLPFFSSFSWLHFFPIAVKI